MTLWADNGVEIVDSSVILTSLLVSDARADEPIVIADGVAVFVNIVELSVTDEPVVILSGVLVFTGTVVFSTTPVAFVTVCCGVVLAATVIFPTAVDTELFSSFVNFTTAVGEVLDSCVTGTAVFVEAVLSVVEVVICCPAMVVGSSSKAVVSSIKSTVGSSDSVVGLLLDGDSLTSAS